MSAPLVKNGRAYILDKSKGLTVLRSPPARSSGPMTTSSTPLIAIRSSAWSADEARDLIALLNASGELVYARPTASGAEELGGIGHWQNLGASRLCGEPSLRPLGH